MQRPVRTSARDHSRKIAAMFDWNIRQREEGDAEPVWVATLLDIGLGFAAVFLIVGSALALGGFSFIQPWLIMIPIVMFAAGVLRSRSPGNVPAKILSIRLFMLLLVFVIGRDPTTIVLGVLITLVPAAAGISTRRFRRTPPSSDDNAA
ncbi:MAG: hypothetical protein WCC27_10330 [Acidobacteriaceae bacterium]